MFVGDVDAAPEVTENQDTKSSPLHTQSRLQHLQEQYSQSRDVASAYVQRDIADKSEQDNEVENVVPKVKFVPRKDRCKLENAKKSRWSKANDVTTNSSNNIVTPTDACAENNPTFSTMGAEVLSKISCTTPPGSPSDTPPGTPPGGTPSGTPGTPIADLPDSCKTPESEEDSWMPALPPAMVDSSTFDNKIEDNSATHKHKKVNNLLNLTTLDHLLTSFFCEFDTSTILDSIGKI